MIQYYEVLLYDETGKLVLTNRFLIKDKVKAFIFKRNWLNKNSRYNVVIYLIKKEVIE
jgi:hypothetical protein